MNAIDDRYHDALGIERIVPPETRDAFLTLLAPLFEEALIPPAIVLAAHGELAFVTTLPAASWTEHLTWTIACEDGSAFRGEIDLKDAPIVDVRERENGTLDRRSIALPALPLGYHRLAVSVGPYGASEAALIVAPPTAHAPPEQRAWGIAIQLYTLRSARNWGIGDFSDLRRMTDIAGERGARYLGLNPLHALHRSEPDAASPYAPTSRSFLNWLYIDVEELPEMAHPHIHAMVDEPDFQHSLVRLRTEPLVDYNGVAECKDAVLRRCFDLFRDATPDDPEFRAFVDAGGVALERFAIFETLVERLGRDCSRWPYPYRDSASPDVAAFADAERPAVQYAMYLQWRASQQLAAAEAGRANGVVLYRDLAVGIDANGADVWVNPRAYVSSASVGAPPDLLNPAGQDWGLPPLDPTALARDGYQTVAELFRANMADAGALRIDHVMALARLFWIPRGAAAAAGAYVRYPLADVLGVLTLESTRAGCVVIGEDLGTVPSGFRETMRASEILSYRILLFERDADGGFTPPDDYPALGLAALGTHDIPPFNAWLDGTDIALRERLGLLDIALVQSERDARERDRRRLKATLLGSGDLAAADENSPAKIMIAAHRFVSRSPARIVMLQLDDVLGETAPVNVPGTWDQYPNWRRKLACDLAAIAADSTFLQLCEIMRAERPSFGGTPL